MLVSFDQEDPYAGELPSQSPRRQHVASPNQVSFLSNSPANPNSTRSRDTPQVSSTPSPSSSSSSTSTLPLTSTSASTATWQTSPSNHSPTHSLCSFTTNSTAITIDFSSDSETSIISPSLPTPPFSPSGPISSPTNSDTSVIYNSILSSSPCSTSSFSTAFQTFSSYHHHSHLYVEISDDKFLKKNLPYKRILSSSPKSSPSSSLIPLDFKIAKSTKLGLNESFQIHKYNLFKSRQQIHRSFWKSFWFFMISLVLIVSFLYFRIQIKLNLASLKNLNMNWKAAYGENLQDVERDSMLIYRIIGNDLPPRHSSNQTLNNLKFIIENENDFQELTQTKQPIEQHYQHQHQYHRRYKQTTLNSLKVKKFYILNRIVNQTQFETVYNLLIDQGIPKSQVLVIPFEIEEYSKRELRAPNDIEKLDAKQIDIENEIKTLDQIKSKDYAFGFQDEFDEIEEKRKLAINRLRSLDSMYHEKNLYAMNNNGGRNFALQHGRNQKDARWILPLDGNCFFTPTGMKELMNQVMKEEHQSVRFGQVIKSHLIIPMSRLLDNEDLLKNNTSVKTNNDDDLIKFKPVSIEEPQIGFRYTSTQTYSNRMRYGRRSKLEFLWRLGAISINRDRLKQSIPDSEVEEVGLIQENSFGSIKRTNSTTSSSSEIDQDFFQAGWVHRLFSGHRKQEEPTESAMSRRSIKRMQAIIYFLNQLDQSASKR